jgi:hypothetical protein
MGAASTRIHARIAKTPLALVAKITPPIAFVSQRKTDIAKHSLLQTF